LKGNPSLIDAIILPGKRGKRYQERNKSSALKGVQENRMNFASAASARQEDQGHQTTRIEKRKQRGERDRIDKLRGIEIVSGGGIPSIRPAGS